MINPRVSGVTPNDDFTLTLTFDNHEKKIFDMKPYLSIGVFKELQEPALFKTVKVVAGAVQWIHEQDLSPDTLYLRSNKSR